MTVKKKKKSQQLWKQDPWQQMAQTQTEEKLPDCLYLPDEMSWCALQWSWLGSGPLRDELLGNWSTSESPQEKLACSTSHSVIPQLPPLAPAGHWDTAYVQ